MKVLVVGSGGREHALAWRIAKSPRVEKVYCAPGNGGTRLVAENVPLAETDIAGLADFAAKEKIGLTVQLKCRALEQAGLAITDRANGHAVVATDTGRKNAGYTPVRMHSGA